MSKASEIIIVDEMAPIISQFLSVLMSDFAREFCLNLKLRSLMISLSVDCVLLFNTFCACVSVDLLVELLAFAFCVDVNVKKQIVHINIDL